MTLAELWLSSPAEMLQKHIRQVIAFCGSGKLRDGDGGSVEFRDFLSRIPSKLLAQYADQCLTNSFDGSGLVLQDVINQVGRRLGFDVSAGRYRGSTVHVGFDGLWRFPENRVLLVEVKTTDAYSIDLDRIAGYRRTLMERDELPEHGSSILLVVGRQDTGSLEAQIRGSRHAWDVRLISVEALLRLMALKEEVEDPEILHKIWDILVPHEFTRLDGIIELVFSAAEDVRDEQPVEDDEPKELESEEPTAARKPKFIPVAFNEACAERIQRHLHVPLLRHSRAKYSSSDDAIRLVCSVAREPDKRTRLIY